jgi:hypothetical protein
MILTAPPAWIVVSIASVFTVVLLVVLFSVAKAKRDVTISITLVEQKL